MKRAQARAINAETEQAGDAAVEAGLTGDAALTEQTDGSATQLTNGANGAADEAYADEPLPGTGIQKTDKFVTEIDPENLIIDPDLRALRAWNGASKQELQLPALAKTIFEEGQREEAKGFITDDGIVLYDGHRRCEAVKIIRDEWDATFMLRIVVDEGMTKDQAIRAAMLADSQHEQFTPRERARNASFLREHFGWKGTEGTAKIAEFLGVSPATVTQDERLAKAPREVQDQVESGRLTVTNALDLIASTGKLPKEEQAPAQTKIVERAAELADEEAKANRKPTKQMNKSANDMRRQIQDGAGQGKVKGEVGSDPSSETTQPDAQETSEPAVESAPVESAVESAPVERRHVKAAAAEVLGEQAKTKAPKMQDAIDLIEPWCGPAYPKVMMAFAEKFVAWAHGKASDKALEAAWDDIADQLAGAGTANLTAPLKVTKMDGVKNEKPVAKSAPKPAPKKDAKPVAKPVAKKVKKPEKKVEKKAAASKSSPTSKAKARK